MKIIHNFLGTAWFSVALLLGLFVAAYWVPLGAMVNTWATNDDYSYGFLVPFVSIYLFWDLRTRLKGMVFSANWAFFPGLVFFILLSIYGILGSSGHIARPAIPVLIFLIAGFCFGREFLKAMWLPLVFLVFMVPLPNMLDRTIGFFLKSISSKLGGALIKLSGISVHVSGNIIDLGVTKLQVVDACSGLRFVFPLLALGIIYAYFFERILWKKALCVFMTVPIAIVTNGIRIGITGILTEYFGPKVAEGFFHDFSGWAIFMFAFVFLLIFGQMLRMFSSKSKNTDKMPKPVQTLEKVYPERINPDVRISMGVTAVLLAAVFLLTLNAKVLPRIDLPSGMAGFPIQFGGWEGKTEKIEADIIRESGAEEAFSATYRSPVDGDVSLYIGYRGSAFLENENFFHSPTVCLPASGWTVLEESNRTITEIPFFGKLVVSRMIMEAMGSKTLVYFWFQTKDRVTHDKNINRFHLTMHAIRKDNTYDLFIRLITTIGNDGGLPAAEDRLHRFAREMMPVLRNFIGTNQNSQ